MKREFLFVLNKNCIVERDYFLRVFYLKMSDSSQNTDLKAENSKSTQIESEQEVESYEKMAPYESFNKILYKSHSKIKL
jgi:hypothetical protein